MARPAYTWTGPGRLLVAALAVVVLDAVPAAARSADQGPRRPDPVVRWVDRHAAPLATVDPAAPLDDLEPLRRAVGGADVVGLGESVHGAAELIGLKQRALRLLVEELGFRSVAWEDDWAVGRRIDAYIRTGAGDPEALVGQMSPQWQSQEVVDVLRWLHDFNVGRTDPVRFVGVEFYLTGPSAYDAVEQHVARVAPERLAEVRAHLDLIRPRTPDVFAHIQWYTSTPDQQPYLDAAHAVLALVDGLAAGPGDPEHDLAVQQARQIAWFYEHFSLSEADALVFRDAHAAENLRFWRDLTGDRIAYWAASPHTANAPDLRLADPPNPDRRFASVGSYLRTWYGDGYRSIGFTLDRGTVSLGAGASAVLPPPAAGWYERPFGAVLADQFVLDLRRRAPDPVRSWLDAPLTTRGLPDGGPDATTAGGTLAEWFDVIVHRQVVTPVHPVPASAHTVTAPAD